MVCISDGRANVPLSASNGEPVSTVVDMVRVSRQFTTFLWLALT